MEKIGIKMGFIFSYFLFTTILFGVLTFLYKIHGLKYLHVMGITFFIAIVGIMTKEFLK